MTDQARVFDSPLEALRHAVERIGSQSATARLLGVTQAAVWGWLAKGTPLPVEHVLKVERETGISRYDLRPDLSDLWSSDDATPAPRDAAA